MPQAPSKKVGIHGDLGAPIKKKSFLAAAVGRLSLRKRALPSPKPAMEPEVAITSRHITTQSAGPLSSKMPEPPTPPEPPEPPEPTEPTAEMYEFELPPDAKPGMTLKFPIPGTMDVVEITVPEGAEPGRTISFSWAETVAKAELPEQTDEEHNEGDLFELEVPPNAKPGMKLRFSIPGTEETVMITVPEGAEPGRTISFSLPMNINEVARSKLIDHESHSAQKIQARVRGRHGRQVLNGQRKSATVIQAHVRGRHGRVVLHAQAESATMIQAHVRGQHDRAAIRSRIEAEAFEAAATSSTTSEATTTDPVVPTVAEVAYSNLLTGVLSEVVIEKRERDSSLGIQLSGDGHPFLEAVAHDALAHGKLFVGDQLLSINGWNAVGHLETTYRLERLTGTIRVRVFRCAVDPRAPPPDEHAAGGLITSAPPSPRAGEVFKSAPTTPTPGHEVFMTAPSTPAPPTPTVLTSASTSAALFSRVEPIEPSSSAPTTASTTAPLGMLVESFLRRLAPERIASEMQASPSPVSRAPSFHLHRAISESMSNHRMEPGSLLHKTELIKSELCLSGTMLAVATEAAKYLGVDMDGKNSAALINECHRELASEPAGIEAPGSLLCKIINIKSELGLSGTVLAIAQEAAIILGVGVTGKNTATLIHDCHQEVARMEAGSLLRKTEVIKSELGLRGTMLAVATEAAKFLGVDIAGKSTVTLIHECHHEVTGTETGSLLYKMDLIKCEMGLSGTISAVATEAAMHLGVDATGKNSAALIHECYQELTGFNLSI